MIRLADHLGGIDVKRTNLDLYLAGNYHGSGGASGPTMHAKDTEHRIRVVREGDIDVAIRAVPPFSSSQEATRAAWSHFMAVMCSRHFFPDANHRTAALAFAIALDRATGTICFLPKEVIPDLVRASKAVRDRDETGRLKHRRFTVADINREEHEYRQVFRRFEGKLVLVPSPP